MTRAKLIEIDWPEFGTCCKPDGPTVAEMLARIEAVRAAMDARGLSHLVVYGDREHFSNLHYLCGFDPRFEEAVLIVRHEADPLLLVGNECEGYVSISPLHGAGRLRHELYQSLSLISQPRDSSRELREILAGEGIGTTSQVGCVGFKYFPEHRDAAHSIEIPAYLVDELRELAGFAAVVNATDLLMHPTTGLRSAVTPTEIAYMEYTAILASEGMRSMLLGVREAVERDWTDHDLARLLGYNGEPLNCHITLVTGENRTRGLSGPIGATIRRGDPLASNFGYWGSNICRAGWIAESEADLPAAARDYAEVFAGVYFAAMSEWFELMTIGTPGARIFDLIHERLPDDVFHIGLNPGHLIHTDEWISSPIYAGSEEVLRSGMAMQVDVIPSHDVYFSTRMEDGIILADAMLQAELKAAHPDCFDRCIARRAFLRDTLGIQVPDEVLPTSNIAAIVPPFFLRPERVFAIA